MGPEEKIQILRQEIERLDDQLVHLLNERAKVALEVGKVKKENQIPIYNPRREKEVVQRVQQSSPGPFPAEALPVVFREVISGCRSLEAEITVVYLGPAATYTHLACIEHFGSSIRALPCESIRDVFEAVERSRADFGVVPVENTTEGAVNLTLDRFNDSEAQICGEVLVRIFHDLLSRTGELGAIRKVYSHPQALGQCREWLRKNLPRVQLIETVSTAQAAQIAVDDPEAAAVASSFAARLYGLETAAARIEDFSNNHTRFLVLGRKMAGRTGRDKTSLIFSMADAPGALYDCLKAFAAKAINLTKIESRPIKDKPWNYLFFLDLEGHADDPPVQEAIAELKKNSLFLKLLGSYPRRS